MGFRRTDGRRGCDHAHEELDGEDADADGIQDENPQWASLFERFQAALAHALARTTNPLCAACFGSSPAGLSAKCEQQLSNAPGNVSHTMQNVQEESPASRLTTAVGLSSSTIDCSVCLLGIYC